jgi:hypothetical protein
VRAGTAAETLLSFWVLLTLAVNPVRAAVVGSESVNQWRRLTIQQNEQPKAYLRGDELRIRFEPGTGHVLFTAHLPHFRIPSTGYQISSALLRRSEKPTLAATANRGWREAAVIGGAEWQELAGHLLEALTPAERGHGRYYQGLMADRLLSPLSNGPNRW